MSNKKNVLIKNGLLVTMNKKREVIKSDLLIEDNKIKKIAKNIRSSNAKIVDASDQFVIPGLIQTHTHLCQTLFRGFADDMALLDWLKKRIWPFEYHHSKPSITASAEISLLEMQLSGTTSILDMATVNHTDALFTAVKKSKMRYWGGKCLMDLKGSSGPLYEPTNSAIKEDQALIKKWHQANDLINYAICPRFAVSCTDEMMEYAREQQLNKNLIVHTHASENKDEIALIKKRTGLGNIQYFKKMKLLNPKTVIVHGIHISKSELKAMISSKTPLVHCPSSNLKLASGIAPIEDYLKQGLTVGIGADGAPCNNSMDPFIEMRLAALIQKPPKGPKALPAHKAFELATLGGAKVLGRSSDLGSLEVGKLADVVTVDRSHPSVATVENPYSALVYSCLGRDVKHVFINGSQVVKNKKHLIYDSKEVLLNGKSELKKLLKRI